MNWLLALLLITLLPSASTARSEADTSLIKAAEDGDAVQIQRLIVHGADVNVLNNFGQTVLEWAAQHGNVAAVKLLLDAGADVSKPSRFGGPLIAASGGGFGVKSIAICRLLLSHGADPNGYANNTPIISALTGLSRSRNSIYHSFHSPRQPQGRQKMFQEQTETTLAILRMLIQSGADVNHEYRLGPFHDPLTPLTAAAGAGSVEAMSLLIKSGAHTDPIYLNVALGPAASSGSAPAVAMLLSHGADPNMRQYGYNHNSTLLEAAGADATESMELLVKSGSNVNAQGADGMTALTLVMQRIKPDLAAIKFLLAHGANPNIADKDGRTPLYRAKESKSAELMTLLENAGAK